MSAHGPCLRIGVNEAAQDGPAHRGAFPVLARALHLPASAVAVTLGQTSQTRHAAADAAVLTLVLEIL